MNKALLVVIALVLLLLMPMPVVKAEGSYYWAKTYGGSGTDVINDVKVLDDGSIIAVGYTNSSGAGDYDVLVMKLSPNGEVEWAKTYGGSDGDLAFAVAVASNGDVIVAGYTESFGAGNGDFWVLRLDENGNVKWQKTYGGLGGDWARAVAIAENGDVIVAGYTESFGAGEEDVWVLRLDKNGNVKWQKTYGGSERDGAFAVAIAENGDIIVAGYTYSFGAGGLDVWVLRLDENGNVKWQKTYGGDLAFAVAVASNGDVIVAGETWSSGVSTDDVQVLRLDENGNVKWQKTYGGLGGDWATAVAIAENGDVIVAGSTGSFSAGWYDFWVLRLDENGNVKWQKTYGGSGYDYAKAVAIAPNGDIITCGEYEGSISYTFEGFQLHGGGGDIWVLRLPPNGELPNCDFCDDSNAQVKDSHVKTITSDATVEATHAEIQDTNAEVQDTNVEVKTQYYKKVEGFNTTYLIAALVGLVLIGGVAAKAKGGKSKEKPRTTEVRAEEKPKSVQKVKAEPRKSAPEKKPKPAPIEVKKPASKTEERTVPEVKKPALPKPLVPGFPSALLSRYEPLEFIGEGGFAKVFKVKRKKDGRIVALKIPRINERTSKTFIKEVSTWLHLNHPNIVKLYDVDILPVPYLEMEFVEGVNVDGETVRDLDGYPKPVDEETALKLIKGIAEGLKHAHGKGIYHRDLKPLNVLLKSDLTPKITDWGLAKLGTMSSSRSVLGYTPLYASPEHLLPSKYGHTDHRTDIWQLGVTFYELLTGRLPFEGYTYEEVFGKIVDEGYRFTPPSKINSQLAKYDGIFEKLLAKRKEERYQSVDEFLKDLEKLQEVERRKAELEKEVEELKKSLAKSMQALKRSKTAGEMLKNRRLVVETLGKLALAYAELNRKAELLNTLNDLKFYTMRNLDDLMNAINTVEMLIRENLPIGEDFTERLKVLVHSIKRENGA